MQGTCQITSILDKLKKGVTCVTDSGEVCLDNDDLVVCTVGQQVSVGRVRTEGN